MHMLQCMCMLHVHVPRLQPYVQAGFPTAIAALASLEAFNMGSGDRLPPPAAPLALTLAPPPAAPPPARAATLRPGSSSRGAGGAAAGAAAGSSPAKSRAKAVDSQPKERLPPSKAGKSPSKSRGSLTRRMSASVSDLVSRKQ